MSQETPKSAAPVTLYILGFILFLYLAWIGAWLLELALEPRLPGLASQGGRVAYWSAMKLLLWVLPSLVLIRLSGNTLRAIMGANRVRETLLWGGGVGVLLGILNLIVKTVMHRPWFSSSLDWSFLSAVAIAPVVEELAFRGGVLATLLQRYRFFTANTWAALLFLGIHFPGWYFEGHLMDHLLDPVSGALSIFLLGWIFGLVFHKSNSLSASILTHALNNLFSG